MGGGIAGTCQAGVCIAARPPPPPRDPCVGVTCPDSVCKVTGVCDSGTGECSPQTDVVDGEACEDVESGVIAGTCQAGVCIAARPPPAPPDPCVVVTCPVAVCKVAGVCDSGTGECSAQTDVADGEACEDVASGVIAGTCQAGVCIAARPPPAPPADPC